MSTYQIDPSHSSATFSIKHMMIAKVHGGFEKMSGSLVYDPSKLSNSNISVTIEPIPIRGADVCRLRRKRKRSFLVRADPPREIQTSNAVS